MKFIKLNPFVTQFLSRNNTVITIDSDQLPKVMNFSLKWYDTGRQITGYSATIKKTLPLARLLLPSKKYLYVDHINREHLDNRKSNLRNLTAEESAQNRNVHTDSVTGYKGVSKSFTKKGWWRARLRINGKDKYLGTFETKEEAAKAFDHASALHYPATAVLNFKGGVD